MGDSQWDSQDDGSHGWQFITSLLTNIGFSVLEKYTFYTIYRTMQTSHFSVTVNTWLLFLKFKSSKVLKQLRPSLLLNLITDNFRN